MLTDWCARQGLPPPSSFFCVQWGCSSFLFFPRELSQDKLGLRGWGWELILLGYVEVGRVKDWDHQKGNSSSAGIWGGVHGGAWKLVGLGSAF